MNPTRKRLDDDEISKILQNAIPMDWQQEMAVKNFSTMTSSLTNLINLCDHLEHSSSKTQELLEA